MSVEPSPPPEPDPAAETTLPDRRRPGRIATDNPHLIALMREAGRAAASEFEDDAPGGAMDEDDLGPARGIALAVGIGLMLWLLIAVVAVAL